MELFNYQSFEVITKFLKNCDIVVSWWCPKLAHSNTNKHVDIKVAMHEKGLGWILHDLAGDWQAKAHIKDAMDVNGQDKSITTMPTNNAYFN
jgi:pre-mRNA-splicing helicase BRR2